MGALFIPDEPVVDSSEYESGDGRTGINWLAESSGPISSELVDGEIKRGLLIT